MITSKDHDYLTKIAEDYKCPEHDNPLAVAWHSGEDAYVIRCGAGHFPEEIKRKGSLLDEYKKGDLEPVDPDFNLLPTKDLGDNKLLLPDQVQGLIRFAKKYDLDAYRGHVVLMYGQPYIGLDGYLYHASRTDKPYTLTSRPLNTMERKDYQVEEGDHAWIAFLNIDRGEKLFNGMATVTKGELTEESKKTPGQLRYPVVAAKPWQMCQKRAEWQVMRRGFPIGESDKQEKE